jgi:hypothetical protein
MMQIHIQFTRAEMETISCSQVKAMLPEPDSVM